MHQFYERAADAGTWSLRDKVSIVHSAANENSGWLGIDVGLWAAILTIVAAILTFVVGELLKARAERRERRRQVIEAWLNEAAAIADSPSLGAGNQYVRAQLLAVSVSPSQEVVAYWVEEIMAKLSEPEPDGDRRLWLAHLGDALVRWHNGKLRPMDFWVSYKLLSVARNNAVGSHHFAVEHRMVPLITPFRNRLRDRAVMILTVGVDTDNEWWLFLHGLTRTERQVADLLRFMHIRHASYFHNLPRWLHSYVDWSEQIRLRVWGRAVRRFRDWAWRMEQVWPSGANAGA